MNIPLTAQAVRVCGSLRTAPEPTEDYLGLIKFETKKKTKPKTRELSERDIRSVAARKWLSWSNGATSFVSPE